MSGWCKTLISFSPDAQRADGVRVISEMCDCGHGCRRTSVDNATFFFISFTSAIVARNSWFCWHIFLKQVCTSFWIAGGLGGLNSLNCFLNPPNTLSNYVLEGSAIYYIRRIYMDLHNNFGRAPTVEKFNPTANFSQFKHWCVPTKMQ